MSKPYVHAISSAKKFGGQWEDYIEIHELLDSSKAWMQNGEKGSPESYKQLSNPLID